MMIKDRYNIKLDSLINLKRKKGYINGFALIKRVKQIRTRKGDPMAFATVFDETSELELVIMPNTFYKYSKLLNKGNYIFFDGKIDREDSCIVNYIRLLERN